jgi:hypothetical protein
LKAGLKGDKDVFMSEMRLDPVLKKLAVDANGETWKFLLARERSTEECGAQKTGPWFGLANE